MRSRRLKSSLPWIVVCAVASLPLFARLDALPVRLWDESRLAINALEMARGEAHALVPTFDHAPDLWNTKPPLLIWIQALAIRLLGPEELALRLPSALAALATALLLLRFAQKRLRRPWVGAAAAAILVSSAGYVSIHGTRTGDYDALMTLFTTGYGLAWLAWVETGRKGLLYTAAACIAGAILTKGVAGLLPLPSLLLYALLRGRGKWMARSPHLYLAAIGTVAIIAGYYGAREALNPGYLAAVQVNELGGRFMHTIEEHGAPATWYLTNLLYNRFVPWGWGWIPAVALGLLSPDRMARRTVGFCALFCAVHLAVISSAGTKLVWYDLPFYPLAALAAAIGLREGFRWIAQGLALPARRLRWLSVVLVVSVFGIPYYTALRQVMRDEVLPWEVAENHHAAVYLKEAVEGRRPLQATVLAWAGYAPNLDWYRRILVERGAALPSLSADHLAPGAIAFTFQPALQKSIAERFAVDTLDVYQNVVVLRLR